MRRRPVVFGLNSFFDADADQGIEKSDLDAVPGEHARVVGVPCHP